MEKHIFARKEYPCDHCHQIIAKGELYLFGKGREPRYLNDDINNENKQVGIYYYQYRLCLKRGCGEEQLKVFK